MSHRSHRTLLLLPILVSLGLSASFPVIAASGDLDPTFGNGGRVETTISGHGREVSVQPEGKIIVHSTESIYRFNTNGTPDPTFGSNGKLFLDQHASFTVLPDGQILGTTTVYGASSQQWWGVVYWFDADGRPPKTGIERLDFDACYADTRGYTITNGLNGQFYVAAFCSANTYILRFNVDGTHGGFSVNLGTEYVYTMQAQSDGKLVVLTSGGNLRRFNTNGTPDNGFGTNGSIGPLDQVAAPIGIALQADGKILVNFTADYGYTGVKRYNPDGTPDSAFGVNGSSETFGNAMAIQSDGRILVGSGMWLNNSLGFAVIRLLPNGDVDSSFGQNGLVVTVFPGLNSDVSAFAIQPNGKIIALGHGSSPAGSRIVLARYQDQVAQTTPFDYDGDGRADLSVWRPSNGVWHLSRSQAGYTAMGWGVPTDKLTPADFDGDGKTDIAVWRPSSGSWYVVNSGTGTLTVRFWGQAGDIPVPADYDGDGRADLAVFRPSNGIWYRINSSNGHWVILPYAQQGDIPVVSDYDGDGRTDLAVYRPSNGNWYVQRTTAGYIVIPFGSANGVIAPADYTGDGRTDIAVISGQSGNWLYFNWDTGLPTIVIDGYYQTGDIPVPADFNGDGRADFAIFRPSTGIWRLPNAGGDSEVQFGQPGDYPTPGSYIH